MGKKLNLLILAATLTCLSPNFISAKALDTNTQEQFDPINLKESITEDGFKYVTNNDDTITIRAYEGEKTSILIPNEIDGKSVTKIDGIAFEGCKNLTEINIADNNPQYSSEDGILYNKDKTELIRCPVAKKEVTIPDSVTEIAGSAFSSCCNLTEIKIPDGVQVIKSMTFSNCSFSKIYISKGVTEIKECAFFYCPNLTNITVDENNQKYSSEDDVLYNKEKTELIQCPIAKKEVNIHEGVKVLKNSCFVNCSNLTKISIPTSVTEIESAAFMNCSGLTEIEIPEGVTAIRQEAFGYCSKLKKVKIAKSVKDIGLAVFNNCNLTIYGEENSSAQTYANENKIAFKLSSEYEKDIVPDDPIDPETTIYTVKFLNDDGSQIGETQEVEEGKSAIAPADPEKEGYTFTGWDNDFSKVTSNMEVKAIFEKNEPEQTKIYTVKFLNDDNSQIGETQEVEEGKSAIAPDNPEKEGYTFTGWDKDFSKVTSNMEVKAIFEKNEPEQTKIYTVKFLNDDGSQIGEIQEIEEGKSAIAPDNPEKEGYTFTGWDKDFSKVTSNMEVEAIFEKNTKQNEESSNSNNGKKTDTADAVGMTEIFTMFAGLIGTIGSKIKKKK